MWEATDEKCFAMLSRFWEFLRNRSNREIISWIGGGAVVILAALWPEIKPYVFPPDIIPQVISERPEPVASIKERAEAEKKAGNIDRAEALDDIVRYTVSAVTMIDDHQKPHLALDYLREAEDRLKSVWRARSAEDQLLQGYIYKIYAQAYAQSGDNARADEYLDKALKVFWELKYNPEIKDRVLAGAMNGIGNVYYAEKQYKKAIESYKKATELKPDYAYAWHDLFLAYVQLARDGDVDLPALREALRRTKETAHSYPGLDANDIAQLEAVLTDFEQSSRP